MKTSVLMLGCLLASASLAQSTTRGREVWEWKDANGVTHYSDAPAPGARKIVILGATTTPAPTPPATRAAATPTPDTARSNAVQYTSLEIWSPENGASFFGGDAVVNIRMRSEPELAQGDRLLTYLDGKLIPGENLYEHNLSAVERGVHSVTSVILDSKGNEKIRSAPVVFHIKQTTTVDNPRNKGPAVRPPAPKPGG
ncbi:MAG TPA: DUF4124 domain-containing protein [Steroidobacteraceae bacterium]|nr:DUF4124 domain-containing protein [Steroidobacteraceae bacterium]